MDDTTVTAWQFTVDLELSPNNPRRWSSTTGQALADNTTFDGTLGSPTLHATAGYWEVYDEPKSNSVLYLYTLHGPDPVFVDETWGWCLPAGYYCYDQGFYTPWTLTLLSQTSITPEPSSLTFLLLGVIGLLARNRDQ